MKFSYFNILLFSIPLNILINDHSKYSSCINTSNSKTTKPHRSLCECELYSPDNYDNDAEMKRVMQQFEDRTSQRFHEYDERMQSKRMQCKDRCDKEIQKIILKDKIEKELSQHLSTLETNIDTNDIPTCVCEKSLADKVEKGCLRCGYGLGTVAPTVGLIGAVAVNEWTKAATATATQKGIEAGINVVIDTLKNLFHIDGVTDLKWKTLITAQNYTDKSLVDGVIRELARTLCRGSEDTAGGFCLFTDKANTFTEAINVHVPKAISKGTAEFVTVTEAEIGNVTTTGGAYFTGIIVSVVVIVVIVLVMIIIYLVLRNRRKTKMTKKLQYMKLLKE